MEIDGRGYMKVPYNTELYSRSQIKTWCHKSLGPGKVKGAPWSSMVWFTTTRNVFFKNPEHASMFALRWT